MVTCPRCEQQVDETVMTTCPLCFTPLPLPGNQPAQPAGQAAQPAADPVVPPSTSVPPAGQTPPATAPPAYPSPTPAVNPGAPSNRPGRRVALTGEVFDDTLQDNTPPRYVGGALPPQRPAGPPQARPTAARTHRPAVEEARSGSGGGAIVAIVLVLVLALAGAGGWWYFNLRTNPKDQARKYITALKMLDWKTVYELSYLSEEDRRKYPNAQAAADDVRKQLDQNPQLGQLLKTALSSIEVKNVGEPRYASGEATVPVTLSVSLFGQKQEVMQSLTLKNDRGVWKVSGSPVGASMNALPGRMSGGGMMGIPGTGR
ncbi:MAG: hypothetical protein RMJ43_05795 [Chloroherpetonaceae bacterium]|nr:hypothetical protein [Chthonomonadaceae bacterium]MDW8207329.1 hypothetical protein [Chloroherpetonaceae bacterium]